jgi:hypothetical protein
MKRISPVCLIFLVFLLALAGITCMAGAQEIGQPIETPEATQPIATPPPEIEVPIAPMGTLSVTSNPSGATILIDGQVVQYYTTPAEGDVPPGVYTVELTLSGYEPYSTTVEVKDGETSYVHANLIRQPGIGTIDVTSKPTSAMLYVDSIYQGRTPQQVSVAEGNHEIRVEMEGYTTWKTIVAVVPNKVTNINAVLEPDYTFGALSITTNPSKAYIYYQGEYYGTTPKTFDGIPPGQYHIELSKDQYEDWTGYVNIYENKVTSLNVDLKPIPSPTTGSIEVSSVPPGAQVFLDGTYEGKTTSQGLYLSGVAPGKHVITVTHEGYREYSTNVNVNVGETAVVSVWLTPIGQPEPGSLSITSSPSGANVFLNNVFKGVTPLILENLAAGTYSVILAVPGYQDWTTEATVSSGQTTSLTATLTPVSTPTPAPTPTPSGSLPVAAIGGILVIGIVFAARSLKKR